MKRLAVAVVLLCSALAWAGSAPNPGDYNINVHVSSSRINGRGFVTLKVLIDGKKYELEGPDAPVALGDYKARTLQLKANGAGSYDVRGRYEFLFPDGKTRIYVLVGVME